MKYLLATIAFCLTSSPSTLAADYSARFGPGIENSELTGVTKTFGLRMEDYAAFGIYGAAEIGGYVDNGGFGRKSAGVGKLQIGVKPGPATGLYGFAFVGPAGITATDTRLGSYFQFATDVGVGIRDSQDGTFMNVGYSHISNAGLALPNRGRDYAVFSIGVSL